jgi:hypothetical protein
MAAESLILCQALGLSDRRLLALGQDYGCLSVLSRSDGRWTLSVLNDDHGEGG